MGLVIDTSALVALERSGLEWERAVPPELAGEEAVIPAIVYAELLAGARLADTPQRAAARQSMIDALAARVPIVDFGREIAARWADLFAVLRQHGSTVPANDLAVAATALHLGYGLLAGPGDELHFRRVPGLAVHLLGAAA